MKKISIALLVIVAHACSSDNEEGTQAQPNLPAAIISIEPPTGAASDTIAINLSNAGPLNQSSVQLNDIDVNVLSEISTENRLFFQVPQFRALEARFDVTVRTSSEQDSITANDAFEYLVPQIDSLSSNAICQQSDTIIVYGKNFSRFGYDVFERSQNPDFDGFARFSHRNISAARDSLVLVLNDFARFNHTPPYELFLAQQPFSQFVQSGNAQEGDFVPLGEFLFSIFFELDPRTTTTPNGVLIVNHNNSTDRFFVGGVEVPQNFSSTNLVADGFTTFSNYKLPALPPGEYEVTGSTEDGVPLKLIGEARLEVVDITYCPTVNTINRGQRLRLQIDPPFFSRNSCTNCPISVAFVDAQSGMRFETTFDPWTEDFAFENGTVFFDIIVPADIPPNNLYSLEFIGDNQYEYLVAPDCTNPNVFVELP